MYDDFFDKALGHENIFQCLKFCRWVKYRVQVSVVADVKLPCSVVTLHNDTCTSHLKKCHEKHRCLKKSYKYALQLLLSTWITSVIDLAESAATDDIQTLFNDIAFLFFRNLVHCLVSCLKVCSFFFIYQILQKSQICSPVIICMSFLLRKTCTTIYEMHYIASLEESLLQSRTMSRPKIIHLQSIYYVF